MLLELETICRDYRGEQQILLISVGISLPVLREQKIKDLSDQEIALYWTRGNVAWGCLRCWSICFIYHSTLQHMQQVFITE